MVINYNSLQILILQGIWIMLVMLSREKYILNKGFCQLNIISISTKAYLEKSQSNRSHCTFKKF